MCKSLILFAPLLLMSVAVMATEAPPTATSVFAANKAASGGAAWGKIRSIRQVGTIRILGLKGPVKRLIDLKTGAYVTHMKLGLGTMAFGDDGKANWVKRLGGAVLSLDLPIEHARALTRAYLNAKGYWYPDRWPAKMKLLGTRSVKRRIYQLVRVTPQGGAPATLWFDAKTHLLARQVQQAAVGKTVTTFSDYRTVDGVKISFQAHRLAWDNDTWMHAQTVNVNVPTPPNAFAMPAQIFNDVTFAHGATSVTMPFKLVGNHIVIHAAINDHPLQLILDTGFVEAIPPALAKSLDLKPQGSSKSHGFGKKAVETRRARVQTLTLGNQITLHHQVFRILPIGNKQKVLGSGNISGVVGYEIFRRFVVRIDYADKKLTLIKPGTFDSKDAGRAMPIAFAGGPALALPAIKGALDNLKGEFTVDTGGGAPLIMFTPFVMRHDLLSRYKASSPGATGHGIGGKLSVRVVHAGIFMFGPVAIKNPVVLLTDSRQGVMGFKDVAGNIGGPILKRFTVTFDYAHKRMYLKPNAELNRAISLPVEDLKKFVGRYQLRPHAFVTISRAGDQLSMQVNAHRALRIYPESNTDFFLKIADVKLDFQVNASNQVTEVVIHQGGHSFAAKRVTSEVDAKSVRQ